MNEERETMAKNGLTHLDERGQARMVDVGEKQVTERVCVARGEVRMAAETLQRIADGEIPKGDVLTTARLAGIQACKRTDEWIPLAHPLPVDSVEVDLRPDPLAARASALEDLQAGRHSEAEAVLRALLEQRFAVTSTR